MGAWQFPTFAWGSTLSSALSGFTSEVGMGSGGSHSLWPPGITDLVDDSARPGLGKLYARLRQTLWVLYGQASRAISIG